MGVLALHQLVDVAERQAQRVGNEAAARAGEAVLDRAAETVLARRHEIGEDAAAAALHEGLGPEFRVLHVLRVLAVQHRLDLPVQAGADHQPARQRGEVAGAAQHPRAAAVAGHGVEEHRLHLPRREAHRERQELRAELGDLAERRAALGLAGDDRLDARIDGRHRALAPLRDHFGVALGQRPVAGRVEHADRVEEAHGVDAGAHLRPVLGGEAEARHGALHQLRQVDPVEALFGEAAQRLVPGAGLQPLARRRHRLQRVPGQRPVDQVARPFVPHHLVDEPRLVVHGVQEVLPQDALAQRRLAAGLAIGELRRQLLHEAHLPLHDRHAGQRPRRGGDERVGGAGEDARGAEQRGGGDIAHVVGEARRRRQHPFLAAQRAPQAGNAPVGIFAGVHAGQRPVERGQAGLALAGLDLHHLLQPLHRGVRVRPEDLHGGDVARLALQVAEDRPHHVLLAETVVVGEPGVGVAELQEARVLVALRQRALAEGAALRRPVRPAVRHDRRPGMVQRRVDAGLAHRLAGRRIGHPLGIEQRPNEGLPLLARRVGIVGELEHLAGVVGVRHIVVFALGDIAAGGVEALAEILQHVAQPVRHGAHFGRRVAFVPQRPHHVGKVGAVHAPARQVRRAEAGDRFGQVAHRQRQDGVLAAFHRRGARRAVVDHLRQHRVERRGLAADRGAVVGDPGGELAPLRLGQQGVAALARGLRAQVLGNLAPRRLHRLALAHRGPVLAETRLVIGVQLVGLALVDGALFDGGLQAVSQAHRGVPPSCLTPALSTRGLVHACPASEGQPRHSPAPPMAPVRHRHSSCGTRP